MNSFFDLQMDNLPDIPNSAYARFDQTEPIDIEHAKEVVFAFSAVSADWLDANNSDAFDFSPNGPVLDIWRNYWSELFQHKLLASDDLFEDIPLLRYEMTLARDNPAFGDYVAASLEDRWIRIERAERSAVFADVFGNLFQVDPTSVPVSLSNVAASTSQILSSMFDMVHWPDATQAELETKLQVNYRAEYLAAFDIGQGAATALLDQNQLPCMYYDVGAGCYRNAATTPTPLSFCWTNDPIVLLSHWDSDHWAGANHDNQALSKTWIAPRQTIGTTHSAFASRVLQSGGRILIWPSGLGPFTVSGLQGQSFEIGRCSGRDRNGSGIAVRVDEASDDPTLHWLLMGDAGYHQLPFGLPGNVVAIIVPHHGAKMRGARFTPNRGNGYARLLFSFGPNNFHGRTNVQHPVQGTINTYTNQGWRMGNWQSPQLAGFSVAGNDVLATAEHPSTHLGGVVADWTAIPTPSSRPCSGQNCTTNILQA